MAPQPPKSNQPTTPSEGPEVFSPRLWVIKKMAKKRLDLIPRNVLVDVKMALMHMRGMLALLAKGGDPKLKPVHFDEILERSRKPLPQTVYTVVLTDTVSKAEVTLELSGGVDMEDRHIVDWVAGLNLLEEEMVAFAAKAAKAE